MARVPAWRVLGLVLRREIALLQAPVEQLGEDVRPLAGAAAEPAPGAARRQVEARRPAAIPHSAAARRSAGARSPAAELLPVAAPYSAAAQRPAGGSHSAVARYPVEVQRPVAVACPVAALLLELAEFRVRTGWPA